MFTTKELFAMKNAVEYAIEQYIMSCGDIDRMEIDSKSGNSVKGIVEARYLLDKINIYLQATSL